MILSHRSSCALWTKIAGPPLRSNALLCRARASEGPKEKALHLDAKEDSAFDQQPASHKATRRISLIHFNDVYNIESRTVEPVGGAARLAHIIRRIQSRETSLVLFSGDCLNPSLLSAFTRGQQMVPTLNALGVSAACIGNHDLDFGLDVLRERLAAFRFPWLLSNVLDATTGRPLADAHHSVVITWQGVRIGLLGLVERDWLLTIPSIDAEKDIVYLDFVDEGRASARRLLMEEKADVVIALTHMRDPNDMLLASSVPEISLILGGHDHDYLAATTEPYGTPVIKSGTDFRELSHVHLDIVRTDEGRMTPSSDRSIEKRAKLQHEGKCDGTPRLEIVAYEMPQSRSTVSNAERDTCKEPVETRSKDMQPARISVQWKRIEVNESTPEDPEVAEIVAEYKSLADSRMDEPLGLTFVDLDARFDAVRSRESNIGNLMADAMRLGLDADAAFLNGGTIRSDMVHKAGRLTMRDFVSALPFLDELVVLELSGKDILMALETGVSSWPMREGRFLQVSGIRFKFDPSQPMGCRVASDSVYVAGKPVKESGMYRVATKHYLRSGKDGFETLKSANVIVDGETAPRLATLIYFLLARIEELNSSQQDCSSRLSTKDEDSNGSGRTNGSCGKKTEEVSVLGVVTSSESTEKSFEGTNAGELVKLYSSQSGSDIMTAADHRLRPVQDSPNQPEPCPHGLDALYFYDMISGKYGIAPRVEGRIVNVQQ